MTPKQHSSTNKKKLKNEKILAIIYHKPMTLKQIQIAMETSSNLYDKIYEMVPVFIKVAGEVTRKDGKKSKTYQAIRLDFNNAEIVKKPRIKDEFTDIKPLPGGHIIRFNTDDMQSKLIDSDILARTGRKQPKTWVSGSLGYAQW